MPDIITEKPILVTGAGGWLGAHVVYQLLDKGYSVRGTVRDVAGAKYQFLKSFHPKASTHLELVAADLMKDDGWLEAVKGCDYMLHVASPFTFAYKHEDEVIKPAVEGVERVFKAAFHEDSTIRRIVQTSSVCSVVYGHSDARYKETNEDGSFREFTEDDWSVPERIVGYEKSKTLAEKKAWEMIDRYNAAADKDRTIELSTICPGFIFGPLLDKAHTEGESSAQVKRVLNRTYPFVPPMDSSHVDVRDVALCHILAMEGPSHKVAGERFLARADDGNMTFTEQSKLCGKIFKPYGFAPATTTAPAFLLSMGKVFFSAVRAAADKLNKCTYVSNKKATEVLGMKWRPIEDSFRAHGLTLMKYGALDKRKTPTHDIECYKAY